MGKGAGIKMIHKIYCFIRMLKLWKGILYGDISYYQAQPEGTVWLTSQEAFEIAWLVWMA